MFNFLLPILAGGTATSAAIAGGAALAGAALTRATAKKERANHFANLAYSAQQGGFNPLTVLNATGGGGYGTYAGILSRSPMEAGLNAAAGAYQSHASENRMMKHEVNLQAMRQKHETKLTNMSNKAFSDAAEKTAIEIASYKTNPNQGWSDAELIEQRYGDVASWLYGLGVLGADGWQALKDKTGSMPEGWNYSPPLTRNPKNTAPQPTRPGMTWIAPRNPDALRIEIK